MDMAEKAIVNRVIPIETNQVLFLFRIFACKVMFLSSPLHPANKVLFSKETEGLVSALVKCPKDVLSASTRHFLQDKAPSR